MHLEMVHRVAHVLARGVEPVDLVLERRVRVRVREEEVEDARDRARGRVRARDDRKYTVINYFTLRRGRLVRLILVALRSTGKGEMRLEIPSR